MKKLLLFTVIILFAFPFPAFAGSAKVPSGMADGQVEEKVDEIMDTYIGEDKDIPGAAIAVVQDGEVVLEKGYGVSDMDNQSEVDPEETVFEAASISKLYTWSAVMQLVEQGKIDLDEDIREYLPEDFLELEYSDKITMLDLMNHSAGFEVKTELLMTHDPEKLFTLEDYVSKENHAPKQVFRPGEVTAYSNFSSALAGYIVERVSGEDYAAYMQSHVLDKLNMTHSTFEMDYRDLPEIVDNKSESYVKQGDQFETVDQTYVNGAPAGSLNTTVQDMSQFMLAHLDKNEHPLFEEEKTLKDMHEQTHEYPNNAHGFWERTAGGHRVLEHGGNSLGFSTQMTLVPEEEFGMVLLTNLGEEASGVRIDLENALIGEHEQPEAVSASDNDEKVAGTYRESSIYSNFVKLLPILGDSDVTVKAHEDGGITLQTPMESEPIRYTETGDLLYERVDDTVTMMDKAGMNKSRVHFEMDDEGNVKSMTHGTFTDFLPVSVKDRVDVNLVIMIISVLAFLIYSIVSLIGWIRKRRRGEVTSAGFPATGLLAGIGLLSIVNIAILFTRFLVDKFHELDPLKVHVWVNWLLPVTLIISGYFILKWCKKTTLLRNSARFFLLIVSAIFILFLWNFNLL